MGLIRFLDSPANNAPAAAPQPQPQPQPPPQPPAGPRRARSIIRHNNTAAAAAAEAAAAEPVAMDVVSRRTQGLARCVMRVVAWQGRGGRVLFWRGGGTFNQVKPLLPFYLFISFLP